MFSTTNPCGDSVSYTLDVETENGETLTSQTFLVQSFDNDAAPTRGLFTVQTSSYEDIGRYKVRFIGEVAKTETLSCITEFDFNLEITSAIIVRKPTGNFMLTLS